MRHVAVLVLLLVVGCSPESAGPAPVGPASTRTATVAPPGPSDVVHDSGAQLLDVRVSGRAGGRTVTSAWLLGRRRAIASSDDGFATTTYVRWSTRTVRRYLARPQDARSAVGDRFGMPGLLARAVPYVASAGRPRVAELGGGDGATLFPFEAVSRSDGHGWRSVEVPPVDGERGYVSGGVVLPDGRLLVLLDHWSGDRGGHPSPVWHGLWASRDEDWSSYAPVRPRVPGQVPVAEGSTWTGLSGAPGRDGVAWLTSWDDRVYVSRDGVRWREIRVR
ncbi:hypothetical protein [Nocardioides sp. LS1]|uniref:hypothetical protein n=1 Tax=Nocardioides sp. LS1 TaxID=1027620 RepID=UPI000F61D26F|nr:hypothetical protein [Nocardioides sp. LS1]